MERASGRDLVGFFDTWIYGSAVPKLKFASHVSGGSALLRFEQRGEPVDVPITVQIEYSSGGREELVVALSDKLTERTVPVTGPVRSITANADNGALVEVEK
jgi:aminopeptidase N